MAVELAAGEVTYGHVGVVLSLSRKTAISASHLLPSGVVALQHNVAPRAPLGVHPRLGPRSAVRAHGEEIIIRRRLADEDVYAGRIVQAVGLRDGEASVK